MYIVYILIISKFNQIYLVVFSSTVNNHHQNMVSFDLLSTLFIHPFYNN